MADTILIAYFLSFHFNFQVKVSERRDFGGGRGTAGFDGEKFEFSCLSNTVLEFFPLAFLICIYVSYTRKPLTL